MLKKVSAYWIIGTFAILSFVVPLFSVTATTTGLQLWSIGDDIHHYNTQSVKTDKMTQMIAIEMQQRYKMQHSEDVIVNFMSNSFSGLWAFFTIFGFATISLYLMVILEIFNRIVFHCKRRNKLKV